MRTIDRLRYEFGMPVEYDESLRGYYLTRHDFTLSQLPLNYEELVALLVMCELASLIDDSSLQSNTTSLWAKMTQGRVELGQELEKLKAHFCLDSNLVVKVRGLSFVELLTLCRRNQLVRVVYQMPLPDSVSSSYIGFLEKIYLSEGALKLMLRGATGRQIELHTSYITSIEELREIPEHPQGDAEDVMKSCQKPEAELRNERVVEMVEISIAAPAAHFFAMQRWHAQQEDTWDGNTLTRRFPGVISADVARRVLEVGRFIASVKPQELLDEILQDVSHLWSLCNAER
jgi:predicted DNA-binding transcriptional regulator YafY